MMVVHDERNRLQRIEQLWLVVSVDETGEGVVAAPLNGAMMPLVAADETRLKDIRGLAKHVAQLTKKKLKLVKFTGRVEVEEI